VRSSTPLARSGPLYRFADARHQRNKKSLWPLFARYRSPSKAHRNEFRTARPEILADSIFAVILTPPNFGQSPWCPSSPSFGNQTKQPVESAISQTVAIAASILVCCGCFVLYTRTILVAATAFAVGVGSIGSPRESTLSSDTPRLIRLRRARSVGVIPSIRRKVRVKCAVSENPAL
jgi:hypothetical protein